MLTGMADLYRYRVLWGGFPGSPGYSNFLFDAVPPAGAVRSFFIPISTYLPLGLTLTFPAGGDIFNDTDGQITGSWVGPAGATITGAAPAGPYGAQCGAVVDWKAGAGRVRGRMVQGRTFLVPLMTNAYDNAGSVKSGAQTDILGAANALIAAAATHLQVWSRPRLGASPLPGSSHQVTSAVVPTRQATLRSRRP